MSAGQYVMVSGVPAGTRCASQLMFVTLIRMQPCDTFAPMLDGSFVPCMPICPGPPSNSVNVLENADTP